MRWAALIITGFGVAACAFDAAGVGTSGSGPEVGSADDTTTSGPASTDAGDGSLATEGEGESETGSSSLGTSSLSSSGSDDGTSTTMASDDSDTSSATETSSGDSSSESTGTAIDCAEPQTFAADVASATLQPPMTVATDLNVGMFAYSPVEDDGSIEFTFDLPCPGTYRLWAWVFDGWQGVNVGDPDSFTVVSGSLEGDWFYGCQSEAVGEGWHWFQVRLGDGGTFCDDSVLVELELPAGQHTIEFHNREPENTFNNVAGIAGAVLTTDPGFVPPV
jgi:hypothetical protein